MVSLPMRFPALVLGFAVATRLLAQNGDHPGEEQHPLPAHLKVPPSPVLSAEEELTTFRIAPGFRVELVAADPLVHDPVAMAFGPDGRLWVVEMSGYMPDPDGRGEEARIGSVVVLEDTDGNGRMDKRTVFASGLVLPRALALVGDGVLVAEPPHLWYLRDTNGDGVADQKTEVAADYGGTSNPEHTANGLMWALDNWIYSANFTTRFHYDGAGRFSREPTATRGQWGLSQDDTGRLFHDSNSDPLRADLVPSEYFRRNPYLNKPEGGNVQLVPANLPIWPDRPTPGVNRGYNSLNAEGKITAVTAACGPVVYRGGLFPAAYAGNAFICEPAGNLVKRIALTEHDGTVTGRNVTEGSEFLTSTDERFRPVNLANGPDGALYLVDMYRGLIQHRVYLTTFLRKQVEERGLANGIGMGRIYRIVPDGAPRRMARFDLAVETTAQLVSHLPAANSWWRDTAQRLLVERRDPASIPLLRALARSADAPPLGRLHALWTLQGIDQLDRETVLAAVGSPDERVTLAAIRLAEKWLAQPADREMFRRVTTVADPTPRVILQLALSLGEATGPDALIALAGLAEAHGHQPYVADAIVSGLAGRELEFLKVVMVNPHVSQADRVVTLAASAVLKAGDAARSAGLLDCLAPATSTANWARPALLDGVERFLPKTPEGKSVPGVLPVEPRALLLLAAQPATPAGAQAARLVTLLKWPGKPGLENESAAVAARLTPEEKARFEKGRELFASICAACHQPHGEGLSGLAPQLLYSRYVLGPEQAVVRIVLCGKENDGVVMPALRTLDDESIAAALTFVRQSWGHDAPPVSPQVVTAVRREIGNREEPWTDEELQKFFRK